MRPKESAPGHEAGSTLVEVLVSIVVLSFGLLGMVGLQAASLQNHREARYQATAVRLATELAERMRGNRAMAALPEGANPYLQANTLSAPAPAAPDCFSAGCRTPLEVAQWDVNEWLGRVFDSENGGLPGARVVICYDDAPYDSVGRPRWGCAAGSKVIQVKLGWTRASTDRSKSGNDALERADDDEGHPSVTLPVVTGMPQ